MRILVCDLTTINADDVVVGIGNTTGAEIDKFEKFALTPDKAHKVEAPLVYEQTNGEEGFPGQPGPPVSGARPDRAGFIEMERQDEHHDDGLAHRDGVYTVARV